MCCRFESYLAWENNVNFNYMIGKVQKFFSEVAVELRKVSWSTRQELMDSTWVVLISSAILGAFIAVVDFSLSKCLALVIK